MLLSSAGDLETDDKVRCRTKSLRGVGRRRIREAMVKQANGTVFLQRNRVAHNLKSNPENDNNNNIWVIVSIVNKRTLLLA